jgi:hypothetical protein
LTAAATGLFAGEACAFFAGIFFWADETPKTKGLTEATAREMVRNRFRFLGLRVL